MSDGEFDLARFVSAQEGRIDTACAELRGGRKASHWMWYVFPQVDGLGSSAMAKAYAIGSLAEARAYLAHPVLGPRLEAATAAALESGRDDATALFGHPDDLKFRSSMTLFAIADPDEPLFRDALKRFFGGRGDDQTCRILGEPFTLFT